MISALVAGQPGPGSRRSGGGRWISPPPPGRAPPPLLKQKRSPSEDSLGNGVTLARRNSELRPALLGGLKETCEVGRILRSSELFYSLFIRFSYANRKMKKD